MRGAFTNRVANVGEIIALKITPGIVDDRAVLDAMSRNLKGKLFADKERQLREDLEAAGIDWTAAPPNRAGTAASRGAPSSTRRTCPTARSAMPERISA